MSATKVSDEQPSWNSTESHKAHKQDLERQETIPLNRPGSPEEEEEAAPNDNSKKKYAIFIASLILFFGLFALITWLALRPVYAPTYAIDDIQIRTLAMNATTSTLSADFVYNVTVHNKNRKMGFKYDWIIIDASYSGWNFARNSIAGFKQGKRNNITKTSWHYAQNVTLPQNVATSLTDAIRNGSVPLRVYAKAKLHVKIGKYVSFPLNVNVDCRFVAVQVLVQSPTSNAFNVVSKVCRLTRPRYKKAKKMKVYKPAPVATGGRRGL